MTDAPAGTGAARLRRPSSSSAALALLAFAPLAVIPGGTSAYVLGKLAVVALAVLVAASAPATGRLPRWSVFMIGAGSALLLAAAAASSAPPSAVLGRWPRYEGALALPLYAGALWAGARLLGPGAAPRRWGRLRAALALTSLVLLGFAVAELLGLGLPGSAGRRVGSLQGNASELGLLGATLAVLLAPAAVRERRPLVVTGATGALALVAVSGSRAALLSLAVGLVCLVVGLRGASRATSRAVAAAGTLAACALLVPATRDRLLSSSTIEGRLRLWSETVDLVRAHPWLGVGPSGFLDAVVPFHTRAWAVEVGMENPPDSPHSWPLQAAAAGGIGLLLVAGALATATVVAGVRRVRAADAARRTDVLAALAAVLGYGAALTTHLTAVGTTVLAAAVAGALVARPAPPPGADGPEAPDRSGARGVPLVAWRTAAAALCVVLAAGATAEWVLASAYRSAAVGDVAGSQGAFLAAQRLRPWDADLTAQAAATFTALASAGVDGASAPAVAWGRAAVGRLPDSAQSATALAAALRIDGAPEEALVLLDAWLTRSPYDPAILLQRAATLEALGDLAGAREDLLDATSISPDDPVLWERLAGAASGLGRVAEAADAAARARELGSGAGG